MPRIPFQNLPDHGRLWVFPSSEHLSDDQRARFGDTVDEFLDQWAAHGQPLQASRDILFDRFVVVGVNEDAEKPSGCSIDALVNRLRALGAAEGLSLIDHAPVWYRVGDGVDSVSRAGFRALAGQGQVSPETVVFDTSITTVAELRAGALEKRCADSWHGRAFFRDSVAT